MKKKTLYNVYNVVMIRSDGLTCCFQETDWTRLVERVREEVEREKRYFADGISQGKYVKVFTSNGDRLVDHKGVLDNGWTMETFMENKDASGYNDDANAATSQSGDGDVSTPKVPERRGVGAPYTLAVGDLVRDLRGVTGEVTENDGAGFTVTWADGSEEYHDHFRSRYADGEVWPFRITHLEDIS
tara:strand:- start:270 stop:827 length:558 start_codon:yes stop_codon:yes gene_type:complete